MLQYVAWDPEKDKQLKESRGIAFGDIVDALESGGLLDKYPHPNQQRYPRQQIFAVLAKGYVYLVPFVENEELIFLKTIFPSRKAKKRYENL